MRFFVLLFSLCAFIARADDSTPYLDWTQIVLNRIVPPQTPLDFLTLGTTTCPAEPFSRLVMKPSTAPNARDLLRGMYLYGTDCWAEALQAKTSTVGVYGCKNRKKVSAPAQTDAKYARFMSVHFNAAAECLGVGNYRKLLFGEILKESSLQNRIEGAGDPPARGPFQMTSVAFEDLIQKRNDIGSSPGQRALTTRLNHATQGPTYAEQSPCQVFLPTDRTLLAAKKKPGALLDRLKNSCDPLNGGDHTAESQAAPLYLGMLYNAYQIALVEEKAQSLGVAKKLGWKLRSEPEPDGEFCDQYVVEHRAACVMVIESIVASGHNVGSPSAMDAFETAVKSKSVVSSKRSVVQNSARFASEVTKLTALGKGLASRSDTRKLIALTYYDNPSPDAQRELEKKAFGHVIKGGYRPGIRQELEAIEKEAGTRCF